MGPNRLASLVRPCFVKASLTVEKAVLCYKADRLVAALLSFRSIQSSLAVCKFCAAGEEHCERGRWQVCANLWCLILWHPKCIRTIAAMWAQRTYLQIQNLAWWVVTQRILKNYKLLKLGVGAYPDDMVLQLSYNCLLPCKRATSPPSLSHPNIVACQYGGRCNNIHHVQWQCT